MARNPKTSKKPVSKSPTKAPAKKSTLPAKPAISKNDGDFQEVRTLIDLLKKNHLAVLEFEKGDLKIILKTPAGAAGGATIIHGSAQPLSSQAPLGGVTPSTEDRPPASEPAKSIYKEITSPMVGTFYASPSPESPSFVEVGKTINADSVVCIIEAMKVMNEIKAEIAGKVVEIVAENGKPVQFGQVLFRVS
jgi:acetyl-CoA carboxylase biotin carboxyl carrier protein